MGYMKSLTLNKPLVLAMIGLPGSGKSFFARQFSETFSAPVISYDRLRHIIYPETGYGKDEQTLLQQVAYYETDELLKTQKTFILDGGGMARLQRVELRKKFRAAGYDLLLVWVQTDEDTAKYRSMKRSSRHRNDQYNRSLTSEEYNQLARKFSTPLSKEPSVVISGKHTYPTQAKIVLKRLVAPRTEAVNKQPIVNHGGRSPDAEPPRRSVIIR